MSTPEEVADLSATFRRYLSSVVLHAQAGARAVGLGATDLYALNILELNGAMTPGELGARTGLTTGPTTRLIDRLEQGGYVRRASDPGDRRKVIVEPVDQPYEIDKALAPARKRIGEIIMGYSPEQRAVLVDYFTRAAEAFELAATEVDGQIE
ncbi:MarR family winged helix-turn-helix transcriptional regulator [Nocardia huaxiensis]|uniref:MarR family transcriptional regulator n=1 Tax=Nocardia huaxiensis TaxID=2755382 RepID=A0A7D6ZHX6_9NOCA|nr:MarR family transcriptional regulator [Nocardia huaxiensis]QLY30160.1 MarR family transcriptional regulator [Nocardia huaxiensis]UFS96226.1 MarR family transcriptional regulator [Nocardia huaxiensis]